jgi:hypothetical protein
MAERRLAQLVKVVEEDRVETDQLIAELNEKLVRAQSQTEDAEQKLLDLVAKLEEEKVFSQMMNQVGADKGEGEGLSSDEKILDLQKEISRLENAREEESAQHRETAARATELFDNYEKAREAFAAQTQQLNAVNAQNDSLKLEMKDLKRKTQRMVQLVTQQKKEMEQEFAQKHSGDAAQLQQQHLKDKHQIETLQEEISSLKSQLNSATQSAAAAAPPPPPAVDFLPIAAPPPPPPPPQNRPLRIANNSGGGGGSGRKILCLCFLLYLFC